MRIKQKKQNTDKQQRKLTKPKVGPLKKMNKMGKLSQTDQVTKSKKNTNDQHQE